MGRKKGLQTEKMNNLYFSGADGGGHLLIMIINSARGVLNN